MPNTSTTPPTLSERLTAILLLSRYNQPIATEAWTTLPLGEIDDAVRALRAEDPYWLDTVKLVVAYLKLFNADSRRKVTSLWSEEAVNTLLAGGSARKKECRSCGQVGHYHPNCPTHKRKATAPQSTPPGPNAHSVPQTPPDPTPPEKSQPGQ